MNNLSRTDQSSMQYPPQIEIVPLRKVPRASVRVPGSKSITNRALVLAALTVSGTRNILLDGALQSEDTEAMISGLHMLGFHASPDWTNQQIRIEAWNSDATTVGD